MIAAFDNLFVVVLFTLFFISFFAAVYSPLLLLSLFLQVGNALHPSLPPPGLRRPAAAQGLRQRPKYDRSHSPPSRCHERLQRPRTNSHHAPRGAEGGTDAGRWTGCGDGESGDDDEGVGEGASDVDHQTRTRKSNPAKFQHTFISINK